MGDAKVGEANITTGVDGEPDATDVVEGEVGSAALVDPADNPDGGADLDALPDAADLDAGRPKIR